MATEVKLDRLEPAQRVLVPVDLSPLSYQALDLALRQAGTKTRIRLFFASPPAYTYVPASGGTDLAMTQIYDRTLSATHLAGATAELERQTVGLNGLVDAETVEARQPAEAIAQAARRFKADLVVMTTHGRGGLSRLFSGSVAQRLLHLYSGPIVLLRPARTPGKT